MYATGSREELYALAHQIRANAKIVRGLIRDNQSTAEQIDDALGLNELFIAMLEDALNDHFNGRN